MKLILIKPNIGRMEHSLYIDEARMEPLQLGVIAALTPSDVDITLYDDRMQSIAYDEPADLVAITVETYTARRAYEISAEYRKRGVPVILGGFHPTLIPEEAAQNADSIYLGDAEQQWNSVIADAKAGQRKSIYKATSGIPQPGIITRRNLYQGKGYLPIRLMQFSRGCGNECDYCAISVFFDKTHYQRQIRELITEIETLPKRIIFFVDDNILYHKEAAKQLFRELIPLKVKWVSQASIDMTDDRELMQLMAKSGCLGYVVGFESLDPANLKAMNKAPNLSSDFDSYETQIEIIKDYGLQLWAAFLLGHDNETVDSIRRTLDFALHHKFCFAAFNILMPYPNTPLYKRLKSEGRLLYDEKWWLHPEYRFNHASFIPAKMTPDELTYECFRARKTFNSVNSIVKRAFDFKTNMRSPYRLGIYLAYNPLFRKETFKKQDMKFGYS